ncbi:MAG: hypothetical protein J0I84_11450, partial [Terrimonas sp.]|nr:hypothetical protein [Terrimonas sp.]
KRYLLKSPWDYSFTDFDLKHNSFSMTFDLQLFQILLKTFWEKVKQYQVQRHCDIIEINKRISQYIENTNIRKRARLPTEKAKEQGRVRLMTTALLSYYMNLEELKAFIPQRSFYRIKSDMKKLGLDMTSHTLTIPQPKLDFHDYKIYLSKYH